MTSPGAVGRKNGRPWGRKNIGWVRWVVGGGPGGQAKSEVGIRARSAHRTPASDEDQNSVGRTSSMLASDGPWRKHLLSKAGNPLGGPAAPLVRRGEEAFGRPGGETLTLNPRQAFEAAFQLGQGVELSRRGAGPGPIWPARLRRGGSAFEQVPLAPRRPVERPKF